jgi:hypothetical protein
MLHCNMTMDTDPDPALPLPAPPGGVADDRRSEPPLVYRGADADDWIVKPAEDTISGGGKMVFKGPKAQHLALTYAHERFGNARFFPY